MGAFHAYDIRGIYGVDIDSELAYKVAYFVPRLLEADKVVVGMDARLSSPEMHEAVLRGITDAGADVYDLGRSSTPLVYYATARHGFKASVQITASHNPKEYNGMKISRENALPVGLDTGLGTIKGWIEEGRPMPVASKRGAVHPFDIRREYVDFLLQFKEDISCLKIGMDLSNGMASLFARDIFGDSPLYLFDTPDGSFPGHDPNPLLGENLVPLQKLVIENKCDVGVIYDGDADRVMFVDDRARFVAPDLVIALMSKYFIGERGEKAPRVLQEIRSSKAVGEYLAPMGVDLHTWRVGRAYAAPKLREMDGLWGGELAGHYYFKDFFYSDSGLLASLLVLGVVASFKKQGLGLSELIRRICRYKSSGEVNFKIGSKQEAMDAVREYFTSLEQPTAFFDFDGYRVEFEDWWFNVRPSNTEPYLRFICEAGSDSLLEEKLAAARSVIGRFS